MAFFITVKIFSLSLEFFLLLALFGFLFFDILLDFLSWIAELFPFEECDGLAFGQTKPFLFVGLALEEEATLAKALVLLFLLIYLKVWSL